MPRGLVVAQGSRGSWLAGQDLVLSPGQAKLLGLALLSDSAPLQDMVSSSDLGRPMGQGLSSDPLLQLAQGPLSEWELYWLGARFQW